MESENSSAAMAVKEEAIEADEELVTTPKPSADQEMADDEVDEVPAEHITARRVRLEPTTRGRGILLVDQDEVKRLQEESARYVPFHQRLRTEEENLMYVEQEKLKVLAKIAKENKSRVSSKLDRNQKMRIDPNADFIRILPADGIDHGFSREDLREFYARHGLDRPFLFDLNLPIIRVKDELLDSIKKQNVVIVQGLTGCGKTTQIPQLILEDHARRNEYCNIVITQPRRLAATSVATQVCRTRNWPLGGLCGYKIGQEKIFNRKQTRICYVTTGYLYERLIGDPNSLHEYTHVILDEIHERDLDTDFLILMLKFAFMKEYKGKLIVMSATLDTQQLLNYFGEISAPSKIVPIVQCIYKMFSVHEVYLEDLERLIGFRHADMEEQIEYKLPKMHRELVDIIPGILRYFDRKEIEACGEPGRRLAPERHAVLIFAPGWDEIRMVKDKLRQTLDDNRLLILVLHSEFSKDLQDEVHQPAPAGYRKVIISTNIAESSVTVPDVRYVIDFCLTKVNRCDIQTNYTSLQTEWTNVSSMNQRRGRAGRVSHGVCFRLLTREFIKTHISEHPEPEILRASLEKLVIDAKRFSSDQPKTTLSMALTPPALDNIERTILSLKEIGALSLYKNGKICADDGDLTYAGQVMGRLPIDVRLGKLILFGHAFGKVKEAVILAAALSKKSIFSSYFNSNLEQYRCLHWWSRGLFCDFTAIIHAYMTYACHVKYRTFSSRRDLEDWARKNMLEIKRIKEMEVLMDEIKVRLRDFNINVDDEIKDIRNMNIRSIDNEQKIIDEYYILKFMVASAFYPNYFKTSQVNQDNIIKTLSCKDPTTTVLLKGFKNNNSLYYSSQIRRLISDICDKDFILHFEANRALVVFKKNEKNLHAKIATGVYMAVAAKLLRIKLSVCELSDSRRNHNTFREIEDIKRAEAQKYQFGMTSRITTGTADVTSDPALLIKSRNEFEIVVTELKDSLGHFWAQPNEKEDQHSLAYISNSLNLYSNKMELLRREDLYAGLIVATLFYDPGDGKSKAGYKFYRARILAIHNDCVHVLYIDYGNEEEKDFTLLYKLPKDLENLPQQAIECKLIGMRLKKFSKENSSVAEKAIEQFSTLIYQAKLKARVYSIVDDVVRISLIDITNPLMHKDVIDYLLKVDLVEEIEESEASKRNHQQRMNKSYFIGDRNKSQNEWISVRNLDRLLDQLEFDMNRRMELDHHSPYSPLECEVNAMTQCNYLKKVRIARDSINFVLLDEEPEVRCSSLLVTSRIEINNMKDNGLVIRNTCLFPKIKGLVSLCLLAFSPAVELRVDPKRKKYTGALCGLGFDKETKTPIYLENDVEDVFEVDFDSADLKKINMIRHGINLVIGNRRDADALIENPWRLNVIQSNNRRLILNLLKATRKTIEPCTVERPYKWNQINEDHYANDGFLSEKIDKLIRRSQAFYSKIKEFNFDYDTL